MRRAANEAQAQRWNGEGGRFWITHRERHLAEHRYLCPHLFEAAGISPGERVLDVGCGCGGTTITAAQAAGGAVGVDLSRPMLEVARGLAAQAGMQSAVFVQADAQACPLRRASCDVVISSFGVMFFDDPAAAFASIGAAVRPGGRLAFLCWQHDLHNEVFSIPLRPFGAYLQLPVPPTSEIFFDRRRVSEVLAASGWDGIDVAPVSEPAWVGTDVDDVMAYVRGMPRIRALIAELGDDALSARVLGIVAEQYAARQRDDGVWVRAAAWLVTARRADPRRFGRRHAGRRRAGEAHSVPG